MSQLTFDTFAAVKRLQKSGFTEEQAAAITDIQKEAASRKELATKADLEIALGRLRSELIKWILGTGAALFIAFAALLVAILIWLRPLP